MARMMRLCVIMVVFVAVLMVLPAMARVSISGNQNSGAIYRIDLPDNLTNWNGDLVVFAHGYVAPRPDEPLAIPEDQLSVSGKYVPDLVTGMGYAFAVTSYSKNGLAVVQGMADVLDLVNIFKGQIDTPRHVYLAGVSEGGLITALAVEQHPEVFSGGLALCGPIGDFRRQINYMGDFRVVFDHFFPGLLPPSPIDIPSEVMQNWHNPYVGSITTAIEDYPILTNQLLKVTKAPTDPSNPTTRVEATLGILWYNVFATNDAIETLGGQPFNNRSRFYVGSKKNSRLNTSVQRFKIDPAALAEIENYYQTSGKLDKPLVTLHNTADPITPYWHETLYLGKVVKNGSLLNFVSIPIFRHGHGNFTESEVLAAFALMVKRVTGQEMLTAAQSVLQDPKSLPELLRLAKRFRLFP